jgi:hypothetical protein
MKHGFSTRGKKEKAAPDRRLVGMARAALILRGTTLADWARAEGYLPSTLHNAVSGRRAGLRSRMLRTKLLRELGIGDPCVRAHVREATPGTSARQ